MKKIILSAFLMLFAFCTFAQERISLEDEVLDTAEDCKKVEPKVLICANYLLNNSVKTEPQSRTFAFRYLFRWMDATPDYMFTLDDDFAKLTNKVKNTDLIAVYMAALVKTELEDLPNILSDERVKEKATDYFLDYCANPDNDVKLNKEIKKKLKERKK